MGDELELDKHLVQIEDVIDSLPFAATAGTNFPASLPGAVHTPSSSHPIPVQVRQHQRSKLTFSSSSSSSLGPASVSAPSQSWANAEPPHAVSQKRYRPLSSRASTFPNASRMHQPLDSADTRAVNMNSLYSHTVVGRKEPTIRDMIAGDFIGTVDRVSRTPPGMAAVPKGEIGPRGGRGGMLPVATTATITTTITIPTRQPNSFAAMISSPSQTTATTTKLTATANTSPFSSLVSYSREENSILLHQNGDGIGRIGPPGRTAEDILSLLSSPLSKRKPDEKISEASAEGVADGDENNFEIAVQGRRQGCITDIHSSSSFQNLDGKATYAYTDDVMLGLRAEGSDGPGGRERSDKRGSWADSASVDYEEHSRHEDRDMHAVVVDRSLADNDNLASQYTSLAFTADPLAPNIAKQTPPTYFSSPGAYTLSPPRSSSISMGPFSSFSNESHGAVDNNVNPLRTPQPNPPTLTKLQQHQTQHVLIHSPVPSACIDPMRHVHSLDEGSGAMLSPSPSPSTPISTDFNCAGQAFPSHFSPLSLTIPKLPSEPPMQRPPTLGSRRPFVPAMSTSASPLYPAPQVTSFSSLPHSQRNQHVSYDLNLASDTPRGACSSARVINVGKIGLW